MTKIQLKRSSALLSGSARVPTANQLDYGELAVNYSTTDPQLFYKDSGGNVVSFFEPYAALAGATFTGDVNFNTDVDFDGAVTIKGDSTNGSGKLTLTCENNTHSVNIKAPAHSAAANYTLTLPTTTGTSGNVLTTDGSGGLSWALSSMSNADAAKLAGIEAGATADQTAAEILALLLTVDGSGSGLDADTIDGLNGSQFLRSDTTDTMSGVLNLTSSAQYPLVIDGSDNGKLVLKGSTQPYIRFQEGTVNKAYIQWSDSGELYLVNQEDGSQIRIKDNLEFSADGSTYHSIWHAGNDGAGSGLDADTLDGIQASSFATLSASNGFSNSYNEFGNGTGSVTNDGNWHGRVNVAGTQHARLDVKSVSDGIITSLYAHTGNNAGKIGTSSNHDLIFMTGGNTRATLTTAGSLSTTVQGTLWGSNNDGPGSGLDADTLDGYGWQDNNKYVYGSRILAYDWLRTSAAGQGLYNETTGKHFFSADANYWHLHSDRGLVFYDAYNSSAGGATNRRGYLYHSSAGIGLLNSGGSWAVMTPHNSSQSNILLVGGNPSNNHFNSVSTARMSFGGGNDFTNYHFGTNSENYGGSYTKLDLRWHTGIRIGAQRQYGGTRIYSNEDLSTTLVHFNSDPSGHTKHHQWIEFSNHGLYNPTNSAHQYTNTTTSYSPWIMTGSRSGYTGIVFNYGGRKISIGMFDSSGNGGTYSEVDARWHTYFNHANDCLGVNGSTTSSSYGLYVTGAIYSSDNITAYSDGRKKTNVTTITSALSKVLNLRGVTYNKIENDKSVNEKTEIGVIAQEVEKVVPEVVTYAEDVDQYGVNYGNLTALLIEAVKELKIELNELKESLA